MGLMPTLVLLADPHGSGKTAFINRFLHRRAEAFRFVNPDEVARGLTGAGRSGNLEGVAGAVRPRMRGGLPSPLRGSPPRSGKNRSPPDVEPFRGHGGADLGLVEQVEIAGHRVLQPRRREAESERLVVRPALGNAEQNP